MTGEAGEAQIGLSVARQLAELMNGHLTYRRENHWSIFELELPAAEKTQSANGQRDSDIPEPLVLTPNTLTTTSKSH